MPSNRARRLYTSFGFILSLCIVIVIAASLFLFDQSSSSAAIENTGSDDSIALYQAGCRPTCTPTATSTLKPPTATRTRTPTKTFTPLPTDTPKPPKDTRTFTPTTTGTATETSTPSQTPTSSLTPTSTSTGTSTSTSTPTNTSTSTSTSTPTNTNTPTATPTSTGCLTSASGFTPTPTTATGNAAAQASGSANHLVISEIRTCGPNGGGDEFIELFNPTDATVTLENWQLRVSDASGLVATLITFSANTTLNAGQHVLVAGSSYSGAVKPDFTSSAQIPDDGGVALVQPDNSSADQVGMSNGSAFKEGTWLAPLSALANTSYERKLGGRAGNCVDTDNNANDYSSVPGNPQDLASALTVCAPSGNSGNLTVSGQAQSNFFIDNIQKPPTDFGAHAVAVLVTNILLALVLALVMSVASTILNDVLESNEDELLRFFGPVVGLFSTLGGWLRAFDAKFDKHRIAWVGALLKLAVMLLLYGIIFAYLDPSFNLFSATGWALILGMTISVGFISIVDDIAQYLFLRQHGESASLRVHSANLALAGVSTGFSRFVGLTPGIIFGSPAGIEDVESTHHESSLHLIALGATGIAALIAWLLSPLATQNVWLTTVLLLTFGTGVQTIFFEMLPVRYLHGRSIFERSKVLWVVLFVIIATIFMQTMLNPNGDFIRAFESANMVTLAIVVGLFCVFTAVVWFYFGKKQKKTTGVER